MNSMIKRIKLMIRMRFLHGVDDFAYFLMKISKGFDATVAFNCCNAGIL